LSLMLAFVLMPLIMTGGGLTLSSTLWVLASRIFREVVVGLLIGYTANLIFAVVQVAGELQDTQAGYGFAGVVDPNVSQQSAILGQFQMVLMWLIFLTLNGHHLLLRGLAESFTIIPLDGFSFHEAMTWHFFSLSRELVLLGVRIGAPVLGAVLLTDIGLGLLQRTAPQLNLMAVGFQVKMMAALAILALALPFTLACFRDLIPYMGRQIYDVLALGR